MDYFGATGRSVFSHKDEDYYKHLYMGIILRPTRHFNAGDFVVFWFNNGQAERWPVTAVSSKGHKIIDMYVQFQIWYPGLRQMTRSRKHRAALIMNPERSGPVSKTAAIIERLDQQIKFVEIMDKWSADPTVQREIVETLRAGSVVRR